MANMRYNELTFVLALLILPIMFSSLAMAVPPVTQLNAEGLIVEYPKINPIALNQSFTFNFHVFNVTRGVEMSNTSVICKFHLYNSTGNHLIVNNNIPFSALDAEWEYTANARNFSVVGQYSGIVYCNYTGATSDNIGGFTSFQVLVTPTGLELEDISMASMIGLGLLMIGLLFIAYMWKDKQIMMKSLFTIAALFVGIIISQTVYLSSIYQLSINRSSSLLGTSNTILIALILITIAFLAISVLINAFMAARDVKKRKKEHKENEIV